MRNKIEEYQQEIKNFKATTVDEIESAFKGSIDDYLAWCKEDGVSPEKPYSGKFNLRISPDLHREVAITAKRMKISINSFVEKAVKGELLKIR